VKSQRCERGKVPKGCRLQFYHQGNSQGPAKGALVARDMEDRKAEGKSRDEVSSVEGS